MLVLTRKPTQQLRIGDDIVITVVKVRGNTIRLGIEAPKDVRVLRAEVEAKDRAQSEPATVSMSILSLAQATEESIHPTAALANKSLSTTAGPAEAGAQVPHKPSEQGLPPKSAQPSVENSPAASAPLKAYNRNVQLRGRLADAGASASQRAPRQISSTRISSLVV